MESSAPSARSRSMTCSNDQSTVCLLLHGKSGHACVGSTSVLRNRPRCTELPRTPPIIDPMRRRVPPAGKSEASPPLPPWRRPARALEPAAAAMILRPVCMYIRCWTRGGGRLKAGLVLPRLGVVLAPYLR